jgi:Bucentaur or craniofacial development
MDNEDFDNELSSDDSDFCPEKHQDSGSGISAPEEDDPEDSDTEKSTKRTKKAKKISKRRGATASAVVEKSDTEEKLDPEEVKRREDAIWAEFLGGSEEPAELKKETATSSKPALSATKPTSSNVNIPTRKPPADISEIFEFAGENVEIPAKTSVPQTTDESKPAPKFAGVKRTGGLSAALNQLTKKNKLSVLEKTKIDWDGFKSNEGIGEELQTHNRGRDG